MLQKSDVPLSDSRTHFSIWLASSDEEAAAYAVAYCLADAEWIVRYEEEMRHLYFKANFKVAERSQ